jgi:hypothetical protein
MARTISLQRHIHSPVQFHLVIEGRHDSRSSPLTTKGRLRYVQSCQITAMVIITANLWGATTGECQAESSVDRFRDRIPLSRRT